MAKDRFRTKFNTSTLVSTPSGRHIIPHHVKRYFCGRDLAEYTKSPQGKLRNALGRSKKGSKKKVTLSTEPWKDDDAS